ncbi:MAG TPA: alpha/beta hydrolase [Xanthobacteraceae bacterium]|nr:alpha/beta hydrolase [Xanthobacteraceae bacterium]
MLISPHEISARTYVLVHGAWHGGWCWRFVADQLAAGGARVFTPTLTGLGERAHLLDRSVNLSTHIEDVCGLIRAENLSGIVLAGHSYGGMVVSGVADRMPEKIRALVILDGFVPADGKAMSDYWPASLKAQWDAKAAASGGLSIPPISAEEFGVNERLCDWVNKNCTPHPYASVNEKIRLTGGREQVATKLYIRAARQRSHAFDGFLKELQADKGWKTLSLDCGHEAMVDAPELLAETLEAI